MPIRPPPSSRSRTRRPGTLARVGEILARAAPRLRPNARLIGGAASAAVLIALGGGWVFGRDRLVQRVGSLASAVPIVRFNWPVSPAPDGKSARRRETWLPPAVQRDLAAVALAELSADPFDQESLERARNALLATGWFSAITSVRRTPNADVDVTAEWRVPAAVVEHKGREYLVAQGGEVLRLPPRAPVRKGTMPVITNPRLGPKADTRGVIYGQPWPGGDVQAAIDLLRLLRRMPESKRIAGVDLTDYIETGRLTLVTDAGGRIVWGSALSALGPGEVPVETRRARLRDILQTRFDESQKRIEIHLPVVLVDKTASVK